MMRADNWELRCRFNRAQIYELGLAAKLHMEYDDQKPADPELGLPRSTMTQMVYYFTDATKACEVARAHWVLLPGFRPDPKRLYLNGVIYRQMKGRPKANRDTELLFGEGLERDAYKAMRRLMCRFLGADLDRVLSGMLLTRMGWPSS
jgi:hypothetical protein